MEVYGEEGFDISVNKPLRENLVVVLTCITLNLHVLICGKPGTSKTLAIDIANRILAMDFQSKLSLQHFKKATFSKFWGSITTTSEGVRKKFDLTIAEQIKNYESGEVKVLVFDEIGLAELAPDNPLKVLHSYLDPGSEDQSAELRDLLIREGKKIKDFDSKTDEEKLKIYKEVERRKIAFVGISNWKLDASKSNRMIFVARPKMTDEDLVCTSRSMFMAYNKKAKILTQETLTKIKSKASVEELNVVLEDIFQIVASTYTKYREWEVRKCDDKNLHGTRDYYYLIKHIVHSITEDTLKHDQDIFANHLLRIVKSGIGRNFCGARDSYKEFLTQLQKEVKVKKPGQDGKGYLKWKVLGDFKIPLQPRVLHMISDNLKGSSVKSTIDQPSQANQRDKVAPPPPRHLYLKTEGSFIDCIVIDMIKKFVTDRQKVKVLSHSLDSDEDIETLSAEIPVYINEGYILILKDMGKIYSLLQEVLNMRYKTIHKKEKSKLIYDDKERDVFIGEGFRCIILQNIDNKLDDGQLLGEAYAPFQNRLEKYILNSESLLEEESFKEYTRLEKQVEEMFVKKETNRMRRDNNLSLDLILHNYSKELLLSIIVSDKQSTFSLEFSNSVKKAPRKSSDSSSDEVEAEDSSSESEDNQKPKQEIAAKSDKPLYDQSLEKHFATLENMYSRNLALTLGKSFA